MPYIYMYICMYVNMYVCTYVYVYMYIYMCVCMYIWTWMCVYLYICMCVYMYTCIYVRMYICISVYFCIYVYLHVCIYVYICICGICSAAVVACHLPAGNKNACACEDAVMHALYDVQGDHSAIIISLENGQALLACFLCCGLHIISDGWL
jgi:hypothetical protein